MPEFTLHTVKVKAQSSVIYEGIKVADPDSIDVSFQGKWRIISIPGVSVKLSYLDEDNGEEVELKLSNRNSTEDTTLLFRRYANE